MKILLVSTQDYIHHPVPSRHHYIFEELAKRHEVHVPHFHVSRGKARETKLIVHEATRFAFQGPLLHYTLNAPFQYAVFNKIIKEEKIDIVVAAHIFAGTAVIRAAKKYGVPVIFDLKDWFPDSAAAYYKNRVLKWLLKQSSWKITKHNLDRSDVITTVSPSLVQRLKDFGYEAKLITNGVNTDYFKPMDGAEGKRALGLTEDSFVIGYVGSLENWLDLDTVIDGFSNILRSQNNIFLAVIGGGLFSDYEKRLRNIVAERRLEDNVRFYGIIKYQELPRYISGMDACLIPFKITPMTDIALPNKFFEYSACGKAILSTPLPDVMKIGGENLFIYKDKNDFVEKVTHIMDNPKAYTMDVSKYSWQSKAKEFEQLLEGLIQKARK